MLYRLLRHGCHFEKIRLPRRHWHFWLFCCFPLVSPATAGEPPQVVVSIKPIHSLVSGVMQSMGEEAPYLIVSGGSPHMFSLKPSDARALQNAAVVFWVSDELEPFLAGPINKLATKALVVELGKIRHADPHLWLDPLNAKAMVAEIVAGLTVVDPENERLYRIDGADLQTRLDALAVELEQTLAAVKNQPFIVFHDAYQHLQRRFQLNLVGAVAPHPEHRPSAGRLRQLNEKIKRLGVRCVFAEPQFKRQLVDALIEGTEARGATLDPLGADLTPGPELYFELLRRNAKALVECLAGPNANENPG